MFWINIRSTMVNRKDHSAKVSACTECGICMERCPFEVDVISKMKQVLELFEMET
jgi:predicted aldo/keto reductase-like oxidoreductase